MDHMAEVHHFAYGWFSPIMACGLAFLGSLLGLGCTTRARSATTRRRRIRWLLLAAVAIGGPGIWLMHFMAMLGFDVPGSEVRYHPGLTALSLVIAVGAVGIGLLVVGLGRRSVPRLVAGGVITGFGVVAMHYTGMAALQVGGELHYEPSLVSASVVVAVVAATVALWFTISVRHGGHLALAAAVMAVAIAGMHYTGMAAITVELHEPAAAISGLSSLLLLVPITVLAAGALLATAFSALQAMTEEEMGAPVPVPRQPTAAWDAPDPDRPRSNWPLGRAERR